MIKTFSVPYPYMVQTLDRYYGVKTRPRKKAAVKTQLKHEHHIPRLYRKKEVIHFDCHVLGLPAHGRFIKLY